MKTVPSLYSTVRNGSFIALVTCLFLLALLLAPPNLSAAPDTQAGWTGGGGGNQNWSSAANWSAVSPNLAPPANPMTQATPGNGSGLIDHSSGLGTPDGAVENVNVPWTIGVLKTTGRSFNLYGADLTIQQATSGSTLTLANGAIQIGNNNNSRTINITNNIIFDDSAFLANPANGSHAIIMRVGALHNINFYGQIRKPSANCSIDIRTSSPVNIYGGISNNPSILDGGLGIAMMSDSPTITFYNANNYWQDLYMNRGVVSIQTNNALPVWSSFRLGDTVNRGVTLALNGFSQTLSNLYEVGVAATVTRTVDTGSGGTLTLTDNAVTNDWLSIIIGGTGHLAKNGTGKLIFEKTQTYTGNTTIGGGILQLGSGTTGGLLSGTGNITNNGTLIINSTDAFTQAGSVTGTGGLQKLAAGITTLNGAVNYTGPTTVTAGTLTIGAAANLSSSSPIFLASGATLDVSATTGLTRSSGQSLGGSGTVSGTVLANPGSIISVGSSPGTLTAGNATLDGAILNMELSGDPTTIGGGVNDLLDVTGTLTLTNVSTIIVSPLAALSTATPYKIIHYGALSGFPSNLTATLPYAGRYGFAVQDNPPYLQVAVTATLNGALLWQGGNPGNPTRWDVATTTNWLNGATPDKFLANDPVAFDDSALTNRATLAATIVSPSLMASNNSLNHTVDGSGSLALTTLGMQGSGGFTVANTSANTIGNVVVNSGSLTIANNAGNSLGNVGVTNGTLTIANNGPNTFTSIAAAGGTLDFNQPTNVTVATAIVGAGTLAKDGTNTLTLAANNSGFTGNLQINNGVLKAGADSAFGSGNSGTIASTATLDLNGFNPGNITLTLQGAGFGGRGAIDNSGGNAFTAFGAVVLAGDTTFGASAPGVEWDSQAAPFTGNGFKVTKVGPGWAFLTAAGDTDIGDMEIKESLFGFQGNGVTMGRAANTITVRSNASLNFFACPTAGQKEIVMDNESLVTAGGSACAFTGNMSITGKVHAVVGNGTTLTYSGSIYGSGKLSRDYALPAGSYPFSLGGVFELAGANTYTGGTEIAAGALRLSHSLALSNNQSILISGTNSGGFNNANTPRLELANNVIIPPGVTANFVPQGDLGSRADFYSFSGANEWQGAIIMSSNGPVEMGSAAGTTLTVSGPIIGTNSTGTLLLRSSGTSQGFLTGPINLACDLAKTDSGTWTISSTSNRWTMTSIAVGTVVLGTNDALCVTAPLIMGQAGNNSPILNLNGFNQRVPSLTLEPSTTAGTKRIGNDSTVSDSVLTYAGGTNFTTYGGVLVDALNTGTMKLALTLESGVLVLNGANTYTGPTLVQNGAVLFGTGSLTSPTTVQSGGAIGVGLTMGLLTINNSLTLNAGSTSILKVVHSPAANDLITGMSSVTYGGTLVITNVGVPALTAGDSFHIFQAGAYSGSFSSIVPATPGPGLGWNTANLTVNGTISVVATAPPNVDIISRRPDGNIGLTLSGPTGSGYTLRVGTNVTVPVSNWNVLTSGTITTSPFTVNDLTATNASQRFYRMSIP